jgi:hypothetical protein
MVVDTTMDSVIGARPQNIEIIGAILLIYCYTFSKGSDIWRVLLVMGISAFCGNVIEASYQSIRQTGYDNPLLSILLVFNEVFWFLMEAAGLLYSYLKLSVVIMNDRLKRICDYTMAILLVVFFSLRLNIGAQRYMANSLTGVQITIAHSYAYIAWGLGDLLVLGIFAANYRNFLKRGNKLAISVLNSSAPRMLIILANTLIITYLGIHESLSIDQQQQQQHTAVNVITPVSLPWLIKRAYNVIFLFDCIISRNMINEVLASEYQ